MPGVPWGGGSEGQVLQTLRTGGERMKAIKIALAAFTIAIVLTFGSRRFLRLSKLLLIADKSIFAKLLWNLSDFCIIHLPIIPIIIFSII